MARGSIYSVLFTLFVFQLLIKVSSSVIVRKKASNTVIKTEFGDMRGLLVEYPTLSLKPVEAYLGIQYASTFASAMRFMPPTSSPDKWKSTRSVVKHRSVCPQRMVDESVLRRQKPVGEVIRLKKMLESVKLDGQKEDCLNLNIYVPGNRGK